MPSAAKPIRVVLDASVLFSAVGFPAGSAPPKIFQLVREGRVQGILSPFILDESETNLRENLAWDESALSRLRQKLKILCGIVDPPATIMVIKRKDSDNRILECAMAARAEVLITSDLRDLRPLNSFKGIEILTPREFLTKYFPPR